MRHYLHSTEASVHNIEGKFIFLSLQWITLRCCSRYFIQNLKIAKSLKVLHAQSSRAFIRAIFHQIKITKHTILRRITLWANRMAFCSFSPFWRSMSSILLVFIASLGVIYYLKVKLEKLIFVRYFTFLLRRNLRHFCMLPPLGLKMFFFIAAIHMLIVIWRVND